MKFIHIADIHLGSWRNELRDYNFKAFKLSIDKTILLKVDFVLIAGDLFDTAYPPLESIKQATVQLQRLKDAKIPVFIITGSHDISNGKTFIDVFEEAGLCKNVYHEEDGELIPTFFNDVAIYGYPGKPRGLDIKDLRKIKYKKVDSKYKILILHTTLDVVVGTLPIDSLESSYLPEMDYYALGHIHKKYNENKIVYPSCIFPNNFLELENVKCGSMVFHDLDLKKTEFIPLKLKEVESIRSDSIKLNLPKNKIICLRLFGNKKLDTQLLDKQAKEKNSILLVNRKELNINIVNNPIPIEGQTEEDYFNNFLKNSEPSKFDELIHPLIHSLSTSINEGEKVNDFKERVINQCEKILKIEQ